MLRVPEWRPISRWNWVRNLLVALTFVLPQSSTWEAPPAASQAALPAQLAPIRPEAISAHMRFLADDLLEGRAPGTRGYDIAAEYVAAEFEAMGLKPAGTNGSFFQPVALEESIARPEDSAISLGKSNNAERLHPGDDFRIDGFPIVSVAKVTAPIAFVGYGVSAPEAGYDDYEGMNAQGKIVAYIPGAPPNLSPDQQTYFGTRQAKLETAAAHGAAAVFSLSSQPLSAELVPPTRIAGVCKRTVGRPPEALPEVSLSPAVAIKLFVGASRQLPQILESARLGKPGSSDLPMVATVAVTHATHLVKSANVVGVLPGSDSTAAGEYVVFSAHLDHLGVRLAADGSQVIYNGALDNASGVAILIETARALANVPHLPRRSILFLGVTGEERGLLGSEYFVRHPTVPRDAIVADINLDGAFMFHRLVDLWAFGAEHSSLGADVAQMAAAEHLKISPDPAPRQSGLVRSDQFSFIRGGIPSVFLFVGFETGDPAVDGVRQFTEWSGSVYHSPKDRFEQPFDFTVGAGLAAAAARLGLIVANRADRPAWNSGDFFGQRFAGKVGVE